MSNSKCTHITNFKNLNDLKFYYKQIYVTFVKPSTSKYVRRTKAEFQKCLDCESRRGIIHGCLSCVYFGCQKNGHINRHVITKNHSLSMDIKFGHIFCHICKDYIYAGDFGTENMKGLRGLSNLGNTCYLNCIIQILTHCEAVKEYFMTKNKGEFKDSVILEEMFVIFEEVYSGNIMPYCLTHLIYFIKIHFKNVLDLSLQQDAHEFFLKLVDILHIQLSGTDTNCACVIHKLFRGFFQSDVICQRCNYTSTTSQEFLDINLNIAERKANLSGPVPLQDCISRFTQAETLPIKCQDCGQATVSKRFLFKKLPTVACFHLNRLEDTSRKKNTRHVMFPEWLDMSPFMTSNQNEQNMITTTENKLCLFGVVIHKGGGDGGHYISYIKHYNKWYQCDDSLITASSLQDVLDSEGYLLFYQKEALEMGKVSTLSRKDVPIKSTG